MMYQNKSEIPLPLAVFLAHDDYSIEKGAISATTIIKPIRQIVLARRVDSGDMVADISSRIASRVGTAIHDAIEKAWQDPKQSLKALGYPPKVIDRIKVNPSPEERDDCIPVYMEQRKSKSIAGYTITGKFDFVADGIVQDFKSTSVFTYIYQSNVEKYALQGSIYRWLNPDIITEDYMYIHYIFTDWSAVKAKQEKDYPQSRLLTQKIDLFSIDQTERYLRNKLRQLDELKDADEEHIPECSDSDLWRTDSVWKYYKNPNATRSTRNFNSRAEALTYFVAAGAVGEIKEVKGQVKACLYCNASAICKQKDRYLQDGSLSLE